MTRKSATNQFVFLAFAVCSVRLSKSLASRTKLDAWNSRASHPSAVWVGQPVQPIRRRDGEPQHYRAARRWGDRPRFRLAHDLGAIAVGDDQAGLIGHDLARHCVGNGEIEPI